MVKEVYPRLEILPCAKLAVQGNSSAPKSVPSSNSHPVRIQSAKLINCADHRVTIDGLGLSTDQECSLVGEMKTEEGRVGREIRRYIPCGKHGRIDLSEVTVV